MSQSLSQKNVRERELESLIDAMKEQKLKQGFVLTENEEENIKREKKRIKIIPIYKWLLA